jgi:uncharacterized membrane-anchored protein YhcB (DUF1043 family)
MLLFVLGDVALLVLLLVGFLLMRLRSRRVWVLVAFGVDPAPW